VQSKEKATRVFEGYAENKLIIKAYKVVKDTLLCDKPDLYKDE
jgi:hypothetical protein